MLASRDAERASSSSLCESGTLSSRSRQRDRHENPVNPAPLQSGGLVRIETSDKRAQNLVTFPQDVFLSFAQTIWKTKFFFENFKPDLCVSSF